MDATTMSASPDSWDATWKEKGGGEGGEHLFVTRQPRHPGRPTSQMLPSR
jgi:hypothetical protein